MTLIEMVRATRDNGHRYCAIDAYSKAYSYPEGYKPYKQGTCFNNNQNLNLFIGKTNFSCKWQNTLIDVTKILVK